MLVQIDVQIAIDQHCGCVIACPKTNYGQQGKTPVSRGTSERCAQLGTQLITHPFAAHDPAADAVADQGHMSTHAFAADKIVKCRNSIEIGQGHAEQLSQIAQTFVGYPSPVPLDPEHSVDAK